MQTTWLYTLLIATCGITIGYIAAHLQTYAKRHAQALAERTEVMDSFYQYKKTSTEESVKDVVKHTTRSMFTSGLLDQVKKLDRELFWHFQYSVSEYSNPHNVSDLKRLEKILNEALDKELITRQLRITPEVLDRFGACTILMAAADLHQLLPYHRGGIVGVAREIRHDLSHVPARVSRNIRDLFRKNPRNIWF